MCFFSVYACPGSKLTQCFGSILTLNLWCCKTAIQSGVLLSLPCVHTDEWCWLLSEHGTMNSSSSVSFGLRNYSKEILSVAVGPPSGCIGRSIPLPPSLSHYIIARFSGSVKNLVQAKLLNSYSGHSTICEQSGRALSGHTVCFGVTGKLLLLWKKSFLRAWVVAPKSKTSLQKS